MKRLMMLALIMLCVLCVLSFGAAAEKGSGTCGNITWRLSDGGALTLSGSGAMPDFYYDYFTRRTSAPWGAYSGDIKSITVSSGITTVGACAFTGCAASGVSLPEGLTSIGMTAFSLCTKLETVVIPASVQSAGYGAFSFSGLKNVTADRGFIYEADICGIFEGTEWLSGYIESSSVLTDSGLVLLGASVVDYKGPGGKLTIPSGVKRIADGALAGSKITSLIIKSGVASIGAYAFSGCEELKSVSLPSSVTQFGDGAFAYCLKLSKVTGLSMSRWEIDSVFSCTPLWFETMSSGASALTAGREVYGGVYSYTAASAGMQCISMDSCEFEAYIYRGGSVTCADAYYNDGDIRFSAEAGESVLIAFSISDDTEECPRVDSVTVLEEFETDDGMLISYNGPGGYVVIPAGITQIGNDVFCRKRLSGVVLPEGLAAIGDDAFTSCGLTELKLPESLEVIGMGAFEGNEFSEITVPDGVVSLGSLAFANCPNLEKVCLGSGLESVPDDCLDGCPLLSEVKFLCDSVSIPQAFLTGLCPLIYCRPDSAAEAWALSQGREVSYLGADASSEIILPEGVKRIGEEAYAGISAIKVTLNEECEYIGPRAFADCKALRVVVIPESVTNIASDAFEGCANVTIIRRKGQK